ncbi:MAG: HAD-IIIA family hydrolase [Armatimonadota bacterium]
MKHTGREHRAVFLDLNGTLVLPVQADSLDEYKLIPGAVEAVRLLNQKGFVCPVVTVQSRIAKEVYSEEAFVQWFEGFQAALSSNGAKVVGPYVCPHRTSDACACAKPQATLYKQAADAHSIDLSRSWVVGDTEGDIRSALAIGALGGCYVRTGWGPQAGESREEEAMFVGDDLLAVAHWILEREIA